MKTVKYMGSTYNVPEWAAFLTFDQFGLVYAFETKPRLEEGHWVQDGSNWKMSYTGKLTIVNCLELS